ncbi:MAG: serine/threonine-protein kinase [Leptolyngbyaceae cyanobacterium bins.302]|nr:serine/threonine-protein kinase [Leptolyngbyaceae cyanobacterium bins.302]
MASKSFRQNLSRFSKRVQSSKGGYILVSAIALAAAIVTTKNPTLVQLWERNLQTFFFDVRGPLESPNAGASSLEQPGIIILAMDGETMTQGTQIYPSDPKQYAYFATIQQWPWQRTAYAIVIDRLMQAGARAVVLDVVLDAPGSYGSEDDEQLRQILEKYPGRVTLAEKYLDEENRAGSQLTLLAPNSVFQSASPNTGFINFLISPNGRIHELGSEYLRRIEQTNDLGLPIPKSISLAESALKSAQVAYSPPTGQDIFFYGPSQTFEQVPFWHVLDPQNWNTLHLKNQTFKNKIVLIGPTGGGETFQDFHLAPFSGTLRYPEKMAGVEIQANAIATLMQGTAIAPVFSDLLLKGIFVGFLVLGAGYVQSRSRRSLRRFWYGLAIAGGWCIISYAVFVGSRVTLPTAVPVVAIISCSLFYLVVGIIRAGKDFRVLASSSEVQSAASEFESPELLGAIENKQREFIGRTLDGRYNILERIGVGGFGETYKAKDLKRPGTPFCVVKRLRPTNKSPKIIRLANNLFNREATVLEQLGNHDRIPQLLAYFPENDEFYLAQEYIDGASLADELKLRKLLRPLSEQAVVMILYELLQILDFVHQQGVIHRDIKPANIILRRSDKKLVLIDFGAVKQVSALEEKADGTVLTVAIGTQGYMAPEQALGMPCSASDIYSVGMTGIRALTGIEPRELDSKPDQSVINSNWKEGIQISHTLAEILDKMVKFDATDRYQSAQAVMADLQPLVEFAQKSGFTPEFFELPPSPVSPDETSTDDEDTGETRRWFSDLPDANLPVTDPDHSKTADSDLGETTPWTQDNTELPPTDSESPEPDHPANDNDE